MLRPAARPAGLLLWRNSLSCPIAGPPGRCYCTAQDDPEELNYDPTSFEARKPRSAKHIELLVKNVEFVREQLKSPPHSKSLEHLATSRDLRTVAKQPTLFIPLVLPEPVMTEIVPSRTRYTLHMEIVQLAKQGKKPVARILREYKKLDLTSQEVQQLATALPVRVVLEAAFEYCANNKDWGFRAACAIVNLAYDCVDMTPQQIRTLFMRLMQEFSSGPDSAHILATLQTAKKKPWLQLNGLMYSAAIGRLALSTDCNPETLLGLVKEAEEGKHALNLHAYNNLIRYFATLQNFEQCQKFEEVARKRHSGSEKFATTLCLLAQAACIVHKPDAAWEYYLELKKKFPDFFIKFKNLFKHMLAVQVVELEKHLDRISILFSDFADAKQHIDHTILRNLLHKRPGFPFYCISILSYSRLHKIRPHPDFDSFVANEMYSKTHTDILNYYLEFQHIPEAAVKELLGSLLYFIPAKAEHAQDVENLVSGLHPVFPPTGATSVRDAYVFATVIDMYGKIAHHEAVAHTFDFMIKEGNIPHFLVHALLFRIHFYTGLTELRNAHYGFMKKCLAGRELGADLMWLCTPLLTYYCETITNAETAGKTKIPELAELRSIIPQVVPYLGIDSRSWTCSRAVTELMRIDAQLAVELLRAMREYDYEQVGAGFQPLIDAMCPTPKSDAAADGKTEKDGAGAGATQRDVAGAGATQKNDAGATQKDDTSGETQEDDAGAEGATQKDAGGTTQKDDAGATQKEAKAKKVKKSKKGEMDVLKIMQDMRVKPSPAQTRQFVRWLCQDKRKFAQAAQLVTDLMGRAPDAMETRQLIAEFLAQCTEPSHHMHMMSVLQALRGIMAQQHATALDMLRWMATHARDAFVFAREEFLKDAPENALWKQDLDKMK